MCPHACHSCDGRPNFFGVILQLYPRAWLLNLPHEASLDDEFTLHNVLPQKLRCAVEHHLVISGRVLLNVHIVACKAYSCADSLAARIWQAVVNRQECAATPRQFFWLICALLLALASKPSWCSVGALVERLLVRGGPCPSSKTVPKLRRPLRSLSELKVSERICPRPS